MTMKCPGHTIHLNYPLFLENILNLHFCQITKNMHNYLVMEENFEFTSQMANNPLNLIKPGVEALISSELLPQIKCYDVSVNLFVRETAFLNLSFYYGPKLDRW